MQTELPQQSFVGQGHPTRQNISIVSGARALRRTALSRLRGLQGWRQRPGHPELPVRRQVHDAVRPRLSRRWEPFGGEGCSTEGDLTRRQRENALPLRVLASPSRDDTPYGQTCLRALVNTKKSD